MNSADLNTHAPVKHLLDNIAWHTLVGPHAKYATGTDDARRYAAGFSPIVGFADTEAPNFDALAGFCGPGEHFYGAEWSGPAPAGWHIDADSTMFQMDNDNAHRLYERMGFRTCRESAIRVVTNMR